MSLTTARPSAIVGASGMAVFPDGKNEALDRIRLQEKDRRKVILAVAFSHFREICLNYASRHAPDLYDEIESIFSRINIQLRLN